MLYYQMICAGSGITPMYQGLQALFDGDIDSETAVTLLYGSKSMEDILLKVELDDLAAAHPDRLTLVYVVGQSPTDLAPEGAHEGGWIDAAKVAKYTPAPSPERSVFVCGLPAMYKALCGSRVCPDVAEGSVLAELGFRAEHVVKF
jgi:cytochrome-b5 reductase